MTTGKPDPTSSEAKQGEDDGLASIREALAGLKYGNVALTVHDGKVVQIDVTQKKRLKPG